MKSENVNKKDIKLAWGSKSPDDPQWPKNESGEFEKGVYLTTVTGTSMDFELTVSLLRGFGVPVVRSYPLAGRFMKVVFGFTGAGMDIFVPESRLEFAKELLDSGSHGEEFFDERQD